MVISKPDVTISLLPASLTVRPEPFKVLIVGQMLTGTAVSGTLLPDVNADTDWDSLFGIGSMLAGACREFRKINKESKLDVLPLADASGTNATGSIAFTGPATEAGTLYVTVGSYYNHRYTLDITNAQTATSIGAALAALINADTKCPVTASASTGTVTLTYAHDGTEGNYTNLRVEGSVAGVSMTVTAFASGATNPTVPDLETVIGSQRYGTIVVPTGYTVSTFLDFLDARFNVDNNILDGVLIHPQVDSSANVISAVTARNSASDLTIALKKITDTYWKGNHAQELPFIVAAREAAIEALRLTPGTNIASYVIVGNGLLDSFGGPALSSLPYFNTPMPYTAIMPAGKEWTPAEMSALNAAGASFYGNNKAGNKVIYGERMMSYKTDNAGNVDPTFKYLNNVRTSSYVREFFYDEFKKAFAQSRLTEGDLVALRNIHNAQSIQAKMDQIYSILSTSDYMLTQSGEQPMAYFKKYRTATVDMVEGSVTLTMRVPIIVALRKLIVAMQISFNIND